MAKQLNWAKVEQTLREKGMMLFTPQDLRHLLNASEVSIRFHLTRAHRRGDVAKLRRGLYALSHRTPSELAIANALLKPSYVSLFYAMAYYSLIPEAPYQVTSVTTRTTRRFVVAGREYVYHHLKPPAFAGYRPERVGDQIVLIAEPEKAFLDALYLAMLRRTSLPERLNTSTLDWKRLRELSLVYGREDMLAALQEYR